MIYAIVVVLVLLMDQAVKLLVTNSIPLNAAGSDCIELLPGVVRLTNIHNTGAAFSILQNARWLLIAVTVIFVVVIVVLISREVIRGRFAQWTCVLVLAGAIGNCIDRVLYGYVVDMFEFEFVSFPVFNVADIFITVCGVLFCISILVSREPKEEAPVPQKNPFNKDRLSVNKLDALFDENTQAPAVENVVPDVSDIPAEVDADRLARAIRASARRSSPSEMLDLSYDPQMPSHRPSPVPAPKKDLLDESVPAQPMFQSPADDEFSIQPTHDEYSLDSILSEFK